VKGDRCSVAFSINSKGQIVGASGICHGGVHAFLWQNGGPMIDLNTRIPPGSGLQLTYAININDRGEIAGTGVLPNGNQRAYLLIPCDGDHDNEGCE
jgi:probable HAF family extracellular repeat protein